MSKFSFMVMSLLLKLRDMYRPRNIVLEEVGIKSGNQVLDFGCGPGGYVLPALELIGESGMFFGLDQSEFAIAAVQRKISRHRLSNVKTILSDCETGLPDESINIVLLYDIYHFLNDPNAVLNEMYRVLRPDGILSVSDHHMKADDIVSGITAGGLFRLSGEGERTHSFSRQ